MINHHIKTIDSSRLGVTHLRESLLRADKAFCNHVVNSFFHNFPFDLGSIFLVEHFFELCVVNLLQFFTVIHDRKMGFVNFSGSVVIGELIISSSDPKSFIHENLKRIKTFESDNEP